MPKSKLTDGEIACLDAMKAIMEVIIARGLIGPDEMAVPFRRMSDQYMQKGMQTASAAMILLASYLEDTSRNADRRLLQSKPAGKA